MSWLTANEPDGSWPGSWYRATTPDLDPCPALEADVRTDVAIVGGGLTGLSAALHLVEAGKDVILLEAVRIGFGASGRSGGQIGSGFNWPLDALERRLGRRRASALWQAAEDAKALTRQLIKTHAPEADYRPGIVYPGRDPELPALVRKDLLRLQERGLPHAMRALEPEEVAASIGTPVYRGGLYDGDAGYCQPLAYVLGLARAARRAGLRAFEGTCVTRLSQGRPHRLETPNGTVTADTVLLAVNGYGPGLVNRVADTVLPINNFIAVTEPLGDQAPMPHPVAVADDRFVVNYWWQSRDGRLVYGGGESYGRRFPSDIARRVRRHIARTYPSLRDVRFSHAWGGTLGITPTRLPLIRCLAPGLLTAGGYSGHGMALSAYAGRAMARHVLGNGDDLALLSDLPTGRLPGGRWLGPWVTSGALAWLSLRDRLGA